MGTVGPEKGKVDEESQTFQKQFGKLSLYRFRELSSFFLMALCNNFGYTLLLTAAHDILKDGGQFEPNDPTLEITRDCNLISTGTILLADALPGLLVKSILPFFRVNTNISMFLTVFLYTSGFLLIGLSTSVWFAVLGTAVTSLSSGFGEVTCLSKSPYYHKTVLGAWSSGNAAAGLLASVALASLTFLGFSTRNIILFMLFIPLLLSVAFWLMLPPRINRGSKVSNFNREITGNIEKTAQKVSDLKPVSSGDKINSIPSLLKYMIPTFSVYFFQYFINQGLVELVEFDNTKLDHNSQYRWIQVVYQCGKFISQSSRGVLKIDMIWLLVLLQFLNLLFFSCEVLFFVTPSIILVFLVSFWEGLVGGASYLNVIRKVSNDVPPHRQDFALVMCSLSDSCGITLASFVAIPVHNLLCQLPKPTRRNGVFQ